jgi:hypothetical protein
MVEWTTTMMTRTRACEGEAMDDWGESEEESGDDDKDIDEVSEGEDMADDWEEDGGVGSNDNDDDNDDSSGGSDKEEVDEIIVERFIRTFHNGDYDAEFDNSLTFDRDAYQIAYQITVRSTQYNKPNNWRERNRIGLEKLKERLQTCIDSVSLGTSFHLDMRHIGGDNEEPIVWHEPILDEYWDLIETEIDRRKKLGMVSDICAIQIENVEMKKERLDSLVAIFRNGGATNLSTHVNFDNANLCEEGIISLSKFVDVSSKLLTVHLHHNRIDNMESARCLSRSLRSHYCINELVITYCDLGSSPEILLVILQSEVRRINLSNNNIDSLGAVTIAEYLQVDPPIEELSLQFNCLDDDDAILISQALKRNTNLHGIYFLVNNLTSIGVKALLTCVFDSSSLNAISESNHKLKNMSIFSEWDDNLAGYIDKMLELDRTEKILLAMQDKDNLLQYLSNLSVEIIPDVFAFVQGQVVDEHQHKHLNIVYCTMRWWNMPLLYSYHNCVKFDTKRKRDN